MAVLFSLLEGLLRRRKYLEASISYATPPKTYYHFSQSASGETNGNFTTY